VPYTLCWTFANDQVADMYHEEVCNRLRERMERAAEKDRTSHERKLPATAKLAMLEDVMAVLRKYVHSAAKCCSSGQADDQCENVAGDC
jgi:anti-sigma factor ChrR (cupin superfamily)